LGSFNLDSTELAPTEIAELIATATDAVAINSFVALTAGAWSAARAFTLIACFRMKELFETYDTRQMACDATGYTSWTDWLTSMDWPISTALIRTRVLDMHTHRNAGAPWPTIYGILSNAPTAGHDVIGTVIDRQGRLLSHINEESLPGGSVEGLMEAIAASPNPGQGRALVSTVAGRPRVYAERMVVSGRHIYLNVVMERPSATMAYSMEITASNSEGVQVHVPPTIAAWLADRLGVDMENYEQ
jgi:hypothetical protein